MYKLLFLLCLLPEPSDFDKAVIHLSGASCIEELSEEEIDRYFSLSENPLPINYSSKSRLESAGLFSSYQIYSLLDYRKEYGDILSIGELALVDGFSARDAEALSHFVRLDGKLDSKRKLAYSHKMTIGSSLKHSEKGSAVSSKLKYEAKIGDYADFYLSSKIPDAEGKRSLGTISLAYYGRRYLNKLVLGNFSARFGQGLTLWSGFRLSGYTSIASFSKKASGISPTGSMNPELFGVASDWKIGNYDLALAYSANDRRLIANLRRNYRNCSIGISNNKDRFGADLRYSLPKMSLYAEISSDYDMNPSAVAGLDYLPRYGEKYAVQLRYFDAEYKKYSGLAFGMEIPSLTATCDFGYRTDKHNGQIKTLLLSEKEYVLREITLKPMIRHSLRYRPGDTYKLRNDLRAELQAVYREWKFATRLNFLWCKDKGVLWYIQGGYGHREKLECNLRLTLYDIENWDDRIYVYQQDAPGNFNVPAFYGHGCSLSLYTAYHINRKHSFWLRFEYKSTWELKIQYRWKL